MTRVLLVAVPKSASTSLAAFICNALKIENRTDLYRKTLGSMKLKEKSSFISSYDFLSYWHSDLFYSNVTAITELPKGNILIKFHWDAKQFPWAQISESDKIIIIDRNAENVVQAYYKGANSLIYPWQGPFWPKFSEMKYRQLIHSEISCFKTGWLERLPDKRILHCSYENLLNSPKQELRKINSFLGIEYYPETSLSLPFKRYSKHKKKFSIIHVGRLFLSIVWGCAEFFFKRRTVHLVRRKLYRLLGKF